MRKMCTLIASKGTDIDENIANQNHATRTRTPKPGYLNSLMLICAIPILDNFEMLEKITIRPSFSYNRPLVFVKFIYICIKLVLIQKIFLEKYYIKQSR
jgi:hypothetical protein